MKPRIDDEILSDGIDDHDDPLERELNLTEVEQRIKARVGGNSPPHRVSQAYATDGFSQDFGLSERGEIRLGKSEIIMAET